MSAQGAPLHTSWPATEFEIILTFPVPSDIFTTSEVRRSLVGLLDFKSSVGG